MTLTRVAPQRARVAPQRVKERALRSTDFLGDFEHSGMIFEGHFEQSGGNFKHILNIS